MRASKLQQYLDNRDPASFYRRLGEDILTTQANIERITYAVNHERLLDFLEAIYTESNAVLNRELTLLSFIHKLEEANNTAHPKNINNAKRNLDAFTQTTALSFFTTLRMMDDFLNEFDELSNHETFQPHAEYLAQVQDLYMRLYEHIVLVAMCVNKTTVDDIIDLFENQLLGRSPRPAVSARTFTVSAALVQDAKASLKHRNCVTFLSHVFSAFFDKKNLVLKEKLPLALGDVLRTTIVATTQNAHARPFQLDYQELVAIYKSISKNGGLTGELFLRNAAAMYDLLEAVGDAHRHPRFLACTVLTISGSPRTARIQPGIDWLMSATRHAHGFFSLAIRPALNEASLVEEIDETKTEPANKGI